MPPTQTTMLRTCNNKVKFTRSPFRTGSKQSYLVEHELDRGEAPAVLRAGAVYLQCIEMGGGDVAHVLGKAVDGIFVKQAAHELIARRLGENRGCGDRRHFVVTLDHGLRTPRPLGTAVAIAKHLLPRAAQPRHGTLLRQPGSMQVV